MFHHSSSINCVVELTGRKCVSHAGGRQSLKAQARQQSRGAQIPRIGDDEGLVTLMKCPECLPFCKLCQLVSDHPVPPSVDGKPKVPSTTSTKVLSSRRIR